MTYEEAIENTVTTREAILELEDHGFRAYPVGLCLVDHDSDETIAHITNGEVSGARVLAWLGY